MNAKEIEHNTWKIYGDCALQYVHVTEFRNMSTKKLYWKVSFKSFNGKIISIKYFNSESNARNFAERFIALLEEQEEL